MLAKPNRLSGRLVVKVHAKGRLSRLPNLTIKSVTNNVGKPRLALVVPKKVDNRATKRNRLKRQILAILEPDIKTSSVGIDLLVMVYGNEQPVQVAKEVKKWFAF